MLPVHGAAKKLDTTERLSCDKCILESRRSGFYTEVFMELESHAVATRVSESACCRTHSFTTS